MPHKGRGIRCRYSSADLEKAVSAVNCGMSVRKAAASFSVPRSTIHDRVSGRVDQAATPGKQTVFPEHVERMLSDKVKEAAQMGFGIDRRQLKVKAARLAAMLKIKTPFKNGIPGDDWVNGFLKRNHISLRSQVPLSTVRSRMLNPTVVTKYFQDLGDALTKAGVSDKPERVWNMDETSVSLTHKPTHVLAEKGSRNVPGRVDNSRESVTVTACVNAAGKDVPPMVVVKGKTRKSLNSFNVAEGPYGARWTFQTKGWMEASLGAEWFRSVFLPNIGPERPQFLILDSHSSHETLEIIECAMENNIVMFTLPPHTTQWLNPLDKTVFGPFSREYDRVCTQYMASSPNNLVCKWVWPSMFKVAYEKTFTQHNISKGFTTCGIFPLNMQAIPQSAFKPSDAFDQGNPCRATQCETASSPSTDVSREMPEPAMSGTVLGTADETGTMTLEAVSAEELLEVLASSGADISTLLPEQSANILPVAPEASVSQVFAIPEATRTLPKKRKCLTSHRVLTSDEIVREKRQAKIKKEQDIAAKEARKQARQFKTPKKGKAGQKLV